MSCAGAARHDQLSTKNSFSLLASMKSRYSGGGIRIYESMGFVPNEGNGPGSIVIRVYAPTPRALLLNLILTIIESDDSLQAPWVAPNNSEMRSTYPICLCIGLERRRRETLARIAPHWRSAVAHRQPRALRTISFEAIGIEKSCSVVDGEDLNDIRLSPVDDAIASEEDFSNTWLVELPQVLS